MNVRVGVSDRRAARSRSFARHGPGASHRLVTVLTVIAHRVVTATVAVHRHHRTPSLTRSAPVDPPCRTPHSRLFAPAPLVTTLVRRLAWSPSSPTSRIVSSPPASPSPYPSRLVSLPSSSADTVRGPPAQRTAEVRRGSTHCERCGSADVAATAAQLGRRERHAQRSGRLYRETSRAPGICVEGPARREQGRREGPPRAPQTSLIIDVDLTLRDF